MMTGYGIGMGLGGFGFLFTALFWIVVIVGGIWLLSRLFPKNRSGTNTPQTESDAALTVLQQRYAKGELSKEAYETIRYDLEA